MQQPDPAWEQCQEKHAGFDQTAAILKVCQQGNGLTTSPKLKLNSLKNVKIFNAKKKLENEQHPKVLSGSSEADLFLNKARQMGAKGSNTHFQLGASPP